MAHPEDTTVTTTVAAMAGWVNPAAVKEKLFSPSVPSAPGAPSAPAGPGTWVIGISGQTAPQQSADTETGALIGNTYALP